MELTFGHVGLVVNNPSLIERAEILREKGADRSRFFGELVDRHRVIDQVRKFFKL